MLYLSGSGMPFGEQVGTMIVTVAADYAPGSSTLGLVKPQMAPIGPASIPCISMMIKLFPMIA